MSVKEYIPLAAMAFMLLIVEILALVLSIPVQTAGIAAFSDPESLSNPVIFFGILIVFTVIMLVLIRRGFKRVFAALIWISLFLTFCYVFSAILFTLGLPEPWLTAVSVLLAIAGTYVLYAFPEWYVINSLGILLAAGVAAIFGISLGIVPVLILLIILAVYDAIAVYRTRHMIALAEGVLESKMPILFVIPKKRGYSFIQEGVRDISSGEGERAAYVMGMGDLIMPAILVVSAEVFIPVSGSFPIGLPALGAMLGSLAGLAVLMHFVRKGVAQAGLPPLNGGAVLGFLVGYALLLL